MLQLKLRALKFQATVSGFEATSWSLALKLQVLLLSYKINLRSTSQAEAENFEAPSFSSYLCSPKLKYELYSFKLKFRAKQMKNLSSEAINLIFGLWSSNQKLRSKFQSSSFEVPNWSIEFEVPSFEALSSVAPSCSLSSIVPNWRFKLCSFKLKLRAL